MKIPVDVQKIFDVIQRGVDNSLQAKSTAVIAGDTKLAAQMTGEVDAYHRVLVVLADVVRDFLEESSIRCPMSAGPAKPGPRRRK